MKLPRRQFLYLAAGATALPAASRLAMAQTYPTRPVRWIVAFPEGGPTDALARAIGQRLSERLGQSFVIENEAGGGRNTAVEIVAHAPADGYTLLMIDVTDAINATVYGKLNFNFIRDIAPVAGIVRTPFVMEVSPSFPAKTITEFIAYAKANPGKIKMASGGTGTPTHMCGEMFKLMARVEMLHVPYRLETPAVTDLIGGKVQVLFGVLPVSIERIKAGEVRPLAVTTATRSEALPNVPTVGEFIFGYEASQWYGIGAPKNTPTEIISKLNNEINAALADPVMKARIVSNGTSGFPISPAEFARLVGAETEKWGKVVRAANIKEE
jgi:tripartite-type tricarboxylate transporter receptor subunit TctC